MCFVGTEWLQDWVGQKFLLTSQHWNTHIADSKHWVGGIRDVKMTFCFPVIWEKIPTKARRGSDEKVWSLSLKLSLIWSRKEGQLLHTWMIAPLLHGQTEVPARQLITKERGPSSWRTPNLSYLLSQILLNRHLVPLSQLKCAFQKKDNKTPREGFQL